MKAMAIVVLLSMVLLSTTALAEVPGLMNYQGTLTDGSGVALDTTVAMTFSVYTDSTAGIQVWTETQAAVTVSSGVFNVLLGSVNAIDDTVFNGPDRWLGIQVGGDAEMTPRQRIASVGYAFVAGSSGGGASDGDWTIWGDDMYSAVSGNVGIGTMTPVTQLHVDGEATIEGRVGIGVPPGPDHELDVIGSVNAHVYRIEGDTVLSADGAGNIFLGHGAGQNITTGSDNTFLGQGAGHSTDTGLYNTFVGQNAGTSSTAGWYDTFVGQAAGRSNTVGWWNTFVGTSAGEFSTSGFGNTFIGGNAGRNNTTGGINTYLGESAGLMCSTGSGNVFIGNLAGAEETGSNKLYIANGPDTSSVLIYGDFATQRIGVGILDPAERLDVAGTVQMMGFKMPTGASDGYLLTTDAAGVASWEPTTAVTETVWSQEIHAEGNVIVDSVLFAGTISSFSPLELQAPEGQTRIFISDSTGNVGMGTLNPGARLEVIAPTGLGVLAEHQASGNYGYLGSDSCGVFGSGSEWGHCGVYGENGTTGNLGYLGHHYYGVYGEYSSSGNYGYLGSSYCGGYGKHSSSGNHGYLGTWDSGVTGVSDSSGYGVRGESEDGAGGVYGKHENSGNVGTLGYRDAGVWAESPSDDAVAGFTNTGNGVRGQSISGIGIYGKSLSGYAGCFDGAIKITNQGHLSVLLDLNTERGWQFRQFGSDSAAALELGNVSLPGKNFVITGLGYMGVGTASPWYKLDVAGSCHASSHPTSSDARFKTNVVQLTGVLDKLENIRGVSFDWNELYESMGRSSNHREIGVIAQELETEYPELVTTWGDEDYRAVEYGRMSAVLIEGIKELNASVKELREENQMLRQEIELLKTAFR